MSSAPILQIPGTTATGSTSVGRRPWRVEWRKHLLRQRDEALGRCAQLEEVWHEAFPKHDFYSRHLKRGWPLEEFDSERWHREIEELAAKQKRDPKMERLRRLIADPSVSFEQAYGELNDPRNRPTPQVVVEAIWLAVRERGLAALQEPATEERLARCDGAARAELKRRLAKFAGDGQ
jgi:hypothetical protein